MKIPNPVIVVTTVGTIEDADAMARALVEERLAACVSRYPVRSTYRWNGEVSCDDEVTLWIKTIPSMADRVQRRIAELHSYELPELLVLKVEASSPSYAAWVAESVDAGKETA